jgi:hypothetical protein
MGKKTKLIRKPIADNEADKVFLEMLKKWLLKHKPRELK